MPYRLSLLTFFLIFCLSACSSKPYHGKGSHNLFTTDIRSDGSKRFVFAMIYPRDIRGHGRDEGKKGGKNRGGDGRPGQGKQRQSTNNRSDDTREEIIALLDEKIAETGYCRNGYIELDYSQMTDKTEIVGECQESASIADKQRWD